MIGMYEDKMKDYTQSQANLIERFEELRWSAEAVDEFLEDKFGKEMNMLSQQDTEDAQILLKDEEPIPLEDLPESVFNMGEWVEKLETHRDLDAELEALEWERNEYH